MLRGDTINFKNIDGPRSLMTAWKKLVSTSPSLRREAEGFLSRGRPRRGLHELEVDSSAGFDTMQHGLDVRDDELGREGLDRIQDGFADGEADFWEDSFYDCDPVLDEQCHHTQTLSTCTQPHVGNGDDYGTESFYDCDAAPDEQCHQVFALPAVCLSAQKKSLHVKVHV